MLHLIVGLIRQLVRPNKYIASFLKKGRIMNLRSIQVSSVLIVGQLKSAEINLSSFKQEVKDELIF